MAMQKDSWHCIHVNVDMGERARQPIVDELGVRKLGFECFVVEINVVLSLLE